MTNRNFATLMALAFLAAAGWVLIKHNLVPADWLLSVFMPVA